MTQEQFLQDMIDTGYVSVKAKELRKLLQKANAYNSEIVAARNYVDKLSDEVAYWKDKYKALKIKENLTIDLKI